MMKIARSRFCVTALVAFLWLQVTLAFAPVVHVSSRRALTTTSLLAATQWDNKTPKKGLATFVSSIALAGTIFASSMVAVPPASLAATEYDISTGAIVVNTSTKPGQSLLKAQVDVKDLLGTAFKNRKALKESVSRIAGVVKEELEGPAWSEIVREVLQTERDVAPSIQVNPPNDVQQLVKDLASGKLNLIVNGELINLSIDEQSTTDTDELVIRAKGIKGVKQITSVQAVAKTRLQEQVEGFDEFWNGEFTLVKVPSSMGKVTNGLVFGGGTVSLLAAVYALSYAYYVQQQDQAAKEAEEKRQVMAKKKAAAEAKAKAAQEGGDGE
jgi:hypothetical protein